MFGPVNATQGRCWDDMGAKDARGQGWGDDRRGVLVATWHVLTERAADNHA
jgi:hypothetical protein